MQNLNILLTAILVGNVVHAKFMGICPFLGVSKKLDSAVGMSGAVTFVLVLATVVTWPIQHKLLDPNGLGYLQTVIFILVIAALVQLVEFILKKFMPPLYNALGIYLPLITTNCAVLGVCILNIDNGYGFVSSIINALGSGLGFLVAMVLFCGVRGKIEGNDIPGPFKGTAITLIAASIVAMSFTAFAGVVDNIIPIA